MSLTATLSQVEADAGTMHSVVHGAATASVVTEGGTVPTLAKALAAIQGGTARGAWVTSTAYAVNDAASVSGLWYRCLIAHTAGTFATDLAAGKWVIWATDGSTLRSTASGATASRTLADLGAESVNALDFGAVGDGVTDDATALQSAVTAWASRGGRLDLPAGKVFLCSGPLNATLQSGKVYGISGIGAKVIFSAIGAGFKLSGACASLKINGIVFDSTNAVVPSTDIITIAITLSSSTTSLLGVSITDCSFDNFGNALRVSGTDRPEIIDCRFLARRGRDACSSNPGVPASHIWFQNYQSTGRVLLPTVRGCFFTGYSGTSAIVDAAPVTKGPMDNAVITTQTGAYKGGGIIYDSNRSELLGYEHYLGGTGDDASGMGSNTWYSFLNSRFDLSLPSGALGITDGQLKYWALGIRIDSKRAIVTGNTFTNAGKAVECAPYFADTTLAPEVMLFSNNTVVRRPGGAGASGETAFTLNCDDSHRGKVQIINNSAITYGLFALVARASTATISGNTIIGPDASTGSKAFDIQSSDDVGITGNTVIGYDTVINPNTGVTKFSFDSNMVSGCNTTIVPPAWNSDPSGLVNGFTEFVDKTVTIANGATVDIVAIPRPSAQLQTAHYLSWDVVVIISDGKGYAANVTTFVESNALTDTRVVLLAERPLIGSPLTLLSASAVLGVASAWDNNYIRLQCTNNSGHTVKAKAVLRPRIPMLW